MNPHVITKRTRQSPHADLPSGVAKKRENALPDPLSLRHPRSCARIRKVKRARVRRSTLPRSRRLGRRPSTFLAITALSSTNWNWFYRTMHGAEVGDLFMTLIHTCQLCGAHSFDYLTELQRHVRELTANPTEWMPWNYRHTVEPPGV